MASQFPELLIRELINDMGLVPNEIAPIQTRIENFTAIADHYIFVLSFVPSRLFEVIVYLNGAPQYESVDYNINLRTITFPLESLAVGDIITGRYTA